MKIVRLVLPVLVLLLPSCRMHQSPAGGSSNTKDISVTLPELNSFTENVALQAKLSGYQLEISSANSDCNHTTPYINKLTSLTISAKILKSCDYKIKLSLGLLAMDGTKFDEIYYVGESSLTAAAIEAQTAGGATKIGVEITLNATAAASKLGFKGKVVTEAMDLDIKVKVDDPNPTLSDTLQQAAENLCYADPNSGRAVEIEKLTDKNIQWQGLVTKIDSSINGIAMIIEVSVPPKPGNAMTSCLIKFHIQPDKSAAELATYVNKTVKFNGKVRLIQMNYPSTQHRLTVRPATIVGVL